MTASASPLAVSRRSAAGSRLKSRFKARRAERVHELDQFLKNLRAETADMRTL